MKSLSFYEFAGIVLPGTIVLLGVSILFPNLKNILFNNSLSVGDFGLVLILAYTTGQIIQAIGNFVENVWWKFHGGMPSDWVRQKKGNLLTVSQSEKLVKLIHSKIDVKINLDEVGVNEWSSLTRQVYIMLINQNRTERIDIFNSYYGMNRGIAAAMVTLIGCSVFSELCSYKIILFLLVVALIALYRMNRFAKHYARELFLQFLEL